MKKILSAILVLTASYGSIQAGEYNSLWHKAEESYVEQHGLPALKPERFSSFAVSEDALRSYLTAMPREYAAARLIDLPAPDGSFRRFRVWSTPVMEESLAKKYPEITTYTAEAVDNGQITAKLDYTPFGFHAIVFDGSSTYLIDPYSGKAEGIYIAYYKKDYKRADGQYMVCELPDDESISGGNNSSNHQRTNGTVRRTYRLAVACTGEYAVAVAGGIPTKSIVLAKMVTSVNRVNGVYEREVSVSMQLIANNDALIYLDGSTDPYTNSSGGSMLGQNQSVIDGIIGSANYDIGHVFSTGGGGVATPGCVCFSGLKAGGVTGSANPQGDAFDIDFVAHEMGHQFSAKHTFNASTGSCAGNGVASAAFEPGAGSTIMAYAGICGGADNFQAHSDPYFHSNSLDEITNFITSSAGSSCASTVTSTNTVATMPSFAASYSIPILTPFELDAPKATDATADQITYCWEERDLGDFGKSLSATELQGPLFRSFPPTESTSRVFITPFRLLSGATSYNAEKLPPKARTMNFKVTERDVYQGWGAFNSPNDLITLQVIGTTGPFKVTSPTPADVWTGGEHRTVSWDVVGTNAAPINCPTVDIYMSVDGGYTFPYVVKANTPNDGSESVIVPNPSTTPAARIKVKGHGNVFFNYSEDFTVVHGTVGVENTSLADKVAISPVPARETIAINAPAALGTLQIRILNTMGQQVWSGAIKERGTLPVDSWARGIYYLHISGERGLSMSRKIVLE